MVLTLMKTAKARLRAARKKIDAGMAERDDAIVDARQEGVTLGDIAAEVGMSIEGVRKVLHRRGEK